MSARLRTRASVLTVLATAGALAMAVGCATPPPSGEPLSDGALAEIADALTRQSAPLEAIRSSGTGVAKFDGRRVEFAFAALYDAPGWARADVRPEAGSLSSTMTALLLWDDECGRCYLPARAVEISGCADGAEGRYGGLDRAALLLGVPDGDLVNALQDARIARRGDGFTIEGTVGGSAVTIVAEGSPPRLRGLSLVEDRTELRLEYEGHGWKPFAWFPKTTEVTVLRGGRVALSARLEFRAARLSSHVDRGSFVFDVPSDTQLVDWNDLDLWRKE